MISEGNRITGVMIQYWKSCKRELWYFSRNIHFNDEDENIRIGRQIQKESFQRSQKEVQLGPIKVDILDSQDELHVHEVKKSDKLEEPAKYQLYYYLWVLEKAGLEVRGFLRYPKQKKKKEIELDDEIISELEKIIKEVKEICSKDTPPEKERKPYCKNCSYYEFCWV